MKGLVSISTDIPETDKSVTLKSYKDFRARLLVYSSMLLLGIDLIYRSYFGISYQNRQDCLLYGILPRWAFLFYEYFIELSVVVIVGIFMATLLKKYFWKLGKFVPRNPGIAFIYASLLPVCSCSAIPLVSTMKDEIPFRTLITFIIAAPLLNPYIITLSAMILGTKYIIFRIICSFILAVSVGYIAEYFHKSMDSDSMSSPLSCPSKSNCPGATGSVYDKTYTIFKKVFLFMIIAGTLSVAIELFKPDKILQNLNLTDNLIGTGLVILVGVPVYFCNGADVLFLKPLMQITGLPLGTAMAFSLTSTSICISSLFLMIKFVGRRLTLIILASVVIITFLISQCLHLVSS